MTSVYEYQNGSFQKIDAWGIYTSKDELLYTKLYRCGIEESNYGYDKSKGIIRSEEEYNSYQARYSFETLN